MNPYINFAFRPEILELRPYFVPPAHGMIKLDAMENPFGLPIEIQELLAHKLSQLSINRYPDASLSSVKESFRTLMSPPLGADIVIGNGSDEILQLLLMAANRPDAVIMGVEPSFVMYRLISQYLGLNYIGIPLNQDFTFPYEIFIKTIKERQPSLIFLAHPNNPTSNCYSLDEIIHVIEQAPGLVVIDEAYYAFTDFSFLPQLMKYPNLIIVRTVSKLGMAGLRLGCAFGHPDWIRPLEGLRLPYNINCFTQAAFEVLVEYNALFIEQTQHIRKERAILYQALRNTKGIQAVWPSECNFLLMRVANAPSVHSELKNQGILVKLLHGTHPLLEHVIRVSIGSSIENKQFLATLNKLVC
ncbi:MAG: histidinol-phosphate transaminase [Pseudomonadota bacterium]